MPILAATLKSSFLAIGLPILLILRYEQATPQIKKEARWLTKNEQDYINAATAVAAGKASPKQKELNDEAAKRWGPLGSSAREAQKKAGKY